MTNLENRNEFRPYQAGMSNREPSMASIILLSKPKSTAGDNRGHGLYDSFRQSVSGDANSLSDRDDTALIDNMSWLEGYTTVPSLDFKQYMTQSNPGRYYGVFNNFSLTGVSEAREELVRINMNFGGNWNAFFFGENPRVFTCQGILLDSPEYPYYQEFVSAYDMYLSGRKSIANGMEIVLTYDGRIISGYLLKLVNDLNSEQYNMKSFVFSILVKSDNWFRFNANTSGDLALNYLDNTERYKDAFAAADAANYVPNSPALTPNVEQPIGYRTPAGWPTSSVAPSTQYNGPYKQ